MTGIVQFVHKLELNRPEYELEIADVTCPQQLIAKLSSLLSNRSRKTRFYESHILNRQVFVAIYRLQYANKALNVRNGAFFAKMAK